MATAVVPMAVVPTAMGPMAVAMDPEQFQAYLIRYFSLRAVELLPSNGGLAAALVSLVIQATSHPDLFDFSQLLCLPAISWVCSADLNCPRADVFFI